MILHVLFKRRYFDLVLTTSFGMRYYTLTYCNTPPLMPGSVSSLYYIMQHTAMMCVNLFRKLYIELFLVRPAFEGWVRALRVTVNPGAPPSQLQDGVNPSPYA